MIHRIRNVGVVTLLILMLAACGGTSTTPSNATPLPPAPSAEVTAYPEPVAPPAEVTAYPYPEPVAPAAEVTAYPSP